MDYFDKKMKSFYNNENNVQIPDGFGWEENADAIYSKMDSQPKRKRRVLFFWFLSGLFLLGIAYVSYHVFSKNNTPQVSEIAVEQDHAVTQELVVPTKIHTVDSKLDNGVDGQASAQKPAHKLQGNGDIFIRRDLDNAVLEVIKDETNHSPSNSPSITKSMDGMNVSMTDNSSIPTTQYNKSIHTNTLLTIEKLNNEDHLIDYSKNKIFINKDVIPFVVNNHSIRSSYQYLTAGGGTLFGFGDYTENQQRNDASSWLPGYHFVLNYGISKGKWAFELGYNHDFAVQLFELNGDDEVEVIVEDVLTQRVTNSLTGQVNNVYEDVAVNVDRYRNYKTYNTFRSHAIGLLVKRNVFASHKWSFDAGLGGRYVFSMHSSGYTLDDVGEVFAYDAENPYYMRSRFDLSGQLSLGYVLSQKLSLNAYLMANQSLSSIMKDQNYALKPLFLGAGIGMHFKL